MVVLDLIDDHEPNNAIANGLVRSMLTRVQWINPPKRERCRQMASVSGMGVNGLGTYERQQVSNHSPALGIWTTCQC